MARPNPFLWLFQILEFEVPAILESELIPPICNPEIDSERPIAHLSLPLRRLHTRQMQLRASSLQYRAQMLTATCPAQREEFAQHAERLELICNALVQIMNVSVCEECRAAYGDDRRFVIGSDWGLRLLAVTDE